MADFFSCRRKFVGLFSFVLVLVMLQDARFLAWLKSSNLEQELNQPAAFDYENHLRKPTTSERRAHNKLVSETNRKSNMSQKTIPAKQQNNELDSKNIQQDPIFEGSSYDKSLGLATALKTTSQEVVSTDNELKILSHPNQAPSNIDETSLVYTIYRHPMDISTVLSKAQIPPPHFPWHFESNSTNFTHEVFDSTNQQYLNSSKLSLYMIHNGTLYVPLAKENLRNDSLDNDNEYQSEQSFVDIIQHSLDLARDLLATNWTIPVEVKHSLRQLIGNNSVIPILFSNQRNWNGCHFYGLNMNARVPIFTWNMPVFSSSCIPIALPPYQIWHKLKAAFMLNRTSDPIISLPWHLKQNKVVWRGQNTGDDAAITEIANLNNNLLDVGFNIPLDVENRKDEIMRELGPLQKNSIPFPKLALYKGLLDIHSSDNRLGRLFCINSVVLRVSELKSNNIKH